MQRLVFAVSLMFAAALLALTVQRAGPAAILDALRSASLPWAFAVLLLTASRTAVSSWRLYAVTQPVAASRFRVFPPLVLGSQFVGLMLPGPRVGPVLWRAHSAGRRLGGGTARHLAPNVADQALLGASWVLVALLTTPFLALPGLRTPPLAALAVILAAPLAAGGAAALLRRRAAPLATFLHRPRAGLRGRIARTLAQAFDGFLVLAGRPASLAASVAGALGFVALTALAQHAALRAVGIEVSPWVSLLAVIAGGVAGLFGLTPGGIGTTEAAQVATLAAQGVPAGPAGAAVVLATGIAYLLALSGGGVAFAREFARR